MNTSPLLITGFHRSGTSAAARALHNAGLHLGDDLLGAEPANPYGHFEDIHAIELHDNALARHGLTWKSPIGNTQLHDPLLHTDINTLVSHRTNADLPWGIKDPRLCLFLEPWLTAAPHANVVVVIRRPGDAIASLHRRHARRLVDTRRVDPSDLAFWQDPDLGLRLWVHYHEQLLNHLPTAERVHVVNFADRSAIENLPATVHEKWDLPLRPNSTTALDPELGGTATTTIEVRDTELLTMARHLWDKLVALAPI